MLFLSTLYCRLERSLSRQSKTPKTLTVLIDFYGNPAILNSRKPTPRQSGPGLPRVYTLTLAGPKYIFPGLRPGQNSKSLGVDTFPQDDRNKIA